MPPVTRRTVLAGAGGALALPLIDGPLLAAAAQPPNIVFILADDLGYADVSCYGRREYRTPAIDRIAAEGIRFVQAYANSAVCSATRTALITGRYQDRLPIGLEEPLASDTVGLDPSVPTLPSLLRKAGYETALVGKWHLGFPPTYGPLKSGYDHFYGIMGGAADYFRHDRQLWNENTKANEVGYLTDLLGAHAVSFIEGKAQQGKPFLLSLHFNAPHWPWEGPDDKAESDRLFALADPEPPLIDFDGGTFRTYAAMVQRMDQQIGRVLDALDRTGLAGNTIVIFTSDNGGERFSDTWPFTGKKTELLEGGLRIPAVIRWPAQLPAGRVSEQVIISMDWLPTLTAAAGTAPDPAFPTDGINLLDLMRAEGAPAPRKLFWRYLNKDQEAARDGNWKYLKILGNSFLFDVAEDPLERANLRNRHPDIFARLVADWQAWNAAMLPYGEATYSHALGAEDVADHYGAPDSSIGHKPVPRHKR